MADAADCDVPINSQPMTPADLPLTRREFLLVAGTAALTAVPESAAALPPDVPLIRSIEQQTLWDNLDGEGISWFHPRACMVPQAEGTPLALMTLQQITGSDYFGPVHWTTSSDLGQSWTAPEPVASLGRQPVPGHEGLLQGVCDVVPEYHPQTDTVLALGHNVFYRGERFSRQDQLARYPVYAVRRNDGTWSPSQRLEWDDPRASQIYSNGCGQRVVLPDGDVLLAFTFGGEEPHRSVAGVRCRFDGERLTVREVGPALSHPHGRGLLEPSLAQFRQKFYLTLRAEDERGYVSVSEDGLRWAPKQEWTWDDGEPLVMSTTQQHWLMHSDGLFLVYTRKDASNANVIRWRSPLFVAQVDPERAVLIRRSERIVHPLVGNGVQKPDDVPLMGNFHVTDADSNESWVTVGSWLPRRDARGATLLARVRWSHPNESAAPLR